MIEKNVYITAVTNALGSNGEGIIRHEGVTFFVPGCLPGEKVVFRVLKMKDKIGYGKVEEVLTPAEERVRPKCPVFMRCGGCGRCGGEYLTASYFAPRHAEIRLLRSELQAACLRNYLCNSYFQSPVRPLFS